MSGLFTTDLGVSKRLHGGAIRLAIAVFLHGVSTTLEGSLLALKVHHKYHNYLTCAGIALSS